jgi:tetratricopeptide (TPR) repeat protein
MQKANPFLGLLIFVIVCGPDADLARAARLGYSRAYCLSEALAAREAISACTAVLQKFRKTPGVWLRRGLAFMELGEFDFAIGDFGRAAGLAPRSAIVFQLRGLALEMSGEVQGALFDYMRALEVNPDDTQIVLAITRATNAFAAQSLAAQSLAARSPAAQSLAAQSDVAPAHDARAPLAAGDRVTARLAGPVSAGDARASHVLFPSFLILATAGVVILLMRINRGR